MNEAQLRERILASAERNMEILHALPYRDASCMESLANAYNSFLEGVDKAIAEPEIMEALEEALASLSKATDEYAEGISRVWTD